MITTHTHTHEIRVLIGVVVPCVQGHVTPVRSVSLPLFPEQPVAFVRLLRVHSSLIFFLILPLLAFKVAFLH